MTQDMHYNCRSLALMMILSWGVCKVCSEEIEEPTYWLRDARDGRSQRHQLQKNCEVEGGKDKAQGWLKEVVEVQERSEKVMGAIGVTIAAAEALEEERRKSIARV
ncbi:hypothetical protein BDZ91DRAFT_764186 [Kalaharituber pfeilii]|nr:hypothetical protein BDZ91DRAFT_764186 [Kalaharituber pfeilii]